MQFEFMVPYRRDPLGLRNATLIRRYVSWWLRGRHYGTVQRRRHPIHLAIEILNTRVIFPVESENKKSGLFDCRGPFIRRLGQGGSTNKSLLLFQYVAWVMTLEENHPFPCVQYSLQCRLHTTIQSLPFWTGWHALDKTVCSVTNGLDFVGGTRGDQTKRRRRVLLVSSRSW